MKKHGTIEGETGSDSWERGRAKDVKLKYCCGSAVCGLRKEFGGGTSYY